MLRRVTIELTDNVQGVFLRSTVKEYADRHGLGGFIKNQYDGTVLLVADGERPAIEALCAWLRTNPGQSRVGTLHRSWSTCPAPMHHFEIQ